MRRHTIHVASRHNTANYALGRVQPPGARMAALLCGSRTKTAEVVSKRTKMNVVPLTIENKRSVSKDWLLGLTVGGYTTLSIALYFFGGGSWISSNFEASYYEGNDFSAPGHLQVFLFTILGLFIGLLDFAQIHSEVFFKRKAIAQITALSVWLNALAVVSFFALIPLKELPWEPVFFLHTVALFVLVTSFCLGNLIGVFHVLWMVTARWRTPGRGTGV